MKMYNLGIRRFSLCIVILTFGLLSCNAQLLHKNPEKKLFGKTLGNKKEVKIKEPRKVMKAKKKQEANDQKLKREYSNLVKKSQKRTLDIQTPEVKERMKQNQKDSEAKYKSKKKNSSSSTKKAGRKYK